MDLYPLGNPDNDLYLYANHWNGLAFINVRHIKNALYVSKQKGISFNSFELDRFREIRRDLEYTISELQSEYMDFYLGKYKLIRYRAESKELEFHKLIATDDHQEYAGSGIILNAEETLAFFASFDTVESDFHQIVKDLPKKSAAEKSAYDAIQTLKYKKRKATDAPVAVAPSTIKYQKQEPEYLGTEMFTEMFNY